jgi:hypothetical protein
MLVTFDVCDGGADVTRAELAGDVGQRPPWCARDGERRADRQPREHEVGARAHERERDTITREVAQRERRFEGRDTAAADHHLQTARVSGAGPCGGGRQHVTPSSVGTARFAVPRAATRVGGAKHRASMTAFRSEVLR